MNVIKLKTLLIITLFIPTILLGHTTQDMHKLKTDYLTKLAHQQICEEYGGIDVSDNVNGNLVVSSGTIDAFVCANLPKNNKHQKAGVLVLGNHKPTDINFISKNNPRWQFSYSKSGFINEPNTLTVYAPSGSVPFKQDFIAMAEVDYDSSFINVHSSVEVGVPADKCSVGFGGLNPAPPLKWFVTCNALVVGGVSSYATYSDVNRHFAKANGTIIQYQ